MPIVIEQLSHIYGAGTPFEVTALDDISLVIEPHEFLGIIGQTGSGKSTLVQHFNGLMKPTKGRVLLRGKDISASAESLRAVRQKVGLVFQYPEHQLFEETVSKDVAFGPKNLGLDGDEINGRVRDALTLVGLNPDEVWERSPFELSGGQMRRVAIAGVVAMMPEVIILDEPTAGLDPQGRDELLQQIRKLHETKGMTVILVSHSMEEIARVADRLIVMHGGRITTQGSPREVFKQAEMLRSIGLGVPQVTELMQALLDKGYDVPSVALSVEEAKQVLLRLRRGGEA